MALFDTMSPEGWLAFAAQMTQPTATRGSPIGTMANAYLTGNQASNAAQQQAYIRQKQQMEMEEIQRARAEAERGRQAMREYKPTGANEYENLLNQARFFQSKGMVKEANAALTMAEKFAPKFKTDIRTEIVDGKPVTVQYGERGERQVVQGGMPYEKPMEVNFGGSVGMYNPLTRGLEAQFARTQSPDNAASVAATYRGQNMMDARARERMEFDRTQAANKPEKSMTEGQAKAYLFGNRMTEANKIFDQIAKDGITRPSDVKSAVQSLPGVGPMLGAAANVAFAGPKEQMLEQAQRDFVNAVLRRESGAVISDQEFANAKQQYFPQIGDSPQVIEQKRRNREMAAQAILTEVPRGVAPPASQAPQQAAGPFADPGKEARYQAWKRAQGL